MNKRMIIAISEPTRRYGVLALGIVLGLLALGQTLWSHRIIADPDDIARSMPLTARALVIAQPIDAQLPTPPSLKSGLPPDPFRQLAKIGVDGFSLKEAAEQLGIDIMPVSTVDLASIDLNKIDADARKCMTQAIYYEAGNQTVAGQMAVADVVLNRVANARYPNTICGVVYQGSTRTTGCQFTFTCDGALQKTIRRADMVKAQILATAVLGGFHIPLSEDATNYHATYVEPYWATSLDETTKIGDHIFYKRGVNFSPAVRSKS